MPRDSMDGFNDELHHQDGGETAGEQTASNIEDSIRDNELTDMGRQAKDRAKSKATEYIKRRATGGKSASRTGQAVKKGTQAAGKAARAGAKMLKAGAKAVGRMAMQAGSALLSAILPFLPVILGIVAAVLVVVLGVSLFSGSVVDNEFSRTNTASYYHMDVEETNALLEDQLGSKGNVYFNTATGRYELSRGKMPTTGNKLYFAYYASMAKNSQWFVEYEVNPDFRLEDPAGEDNPYYILRTIPDNKKRYTLDGHLYSAINMDNVAERINADEPISPDVAFNEEVYTYIEKLAMNVNLLYLLDSTLNGSMQGMGKHQMFFAEQFVKPVHHTKPIETSVEVEKEWYGKVWGWVTGSGSTVQRRVKIDGYDFTPLTEYREMTEDELIRYESKGRPVEGFSSAMTDDEEDSGLSEDDAYQEFKEDAHIHYIGDSLMAGLGGMIQAQLPNATVDGLVSRQFYGGGVEDGSAALKNTPANTDHLVISLGTNAGITEDKLNDFLDEAFQYANSVSLVTTGSNVGHRDSTNEAIRRVAGSRANVGLIDWSKHVDQVGREGLYGGDDIHLSDPGAFADFLVKGSYGANLLGEEEGFNGEMEERFQTNYKSWTLMVETQNLNRGGSLGSDVDDTSSGNSAEGVDNPLLARALQTAIEWVEAGFSYSMENRMGPHSYDCSSFVSLTLKEAGMVGIPEWALSTVTILQNTDTHGGELFREIKPRESAKKGSIVVAGGLGGAGAAGHTAYLLEDYHGPDTLVIESTGNGGAHADLTMATQIEYDPNWVAVEPIQQTLDGSDMPSDLNPGGPDTVNSPIGYTSSGKSAQGGGGGGGDAGDRSMDRNLTFYYDEPVHSEWNGMMSTGVLVAESREFDTDYDPLIIPGHDENGDVFRSQKLRYNIWRRDDFYVEEAPDGGALGDNPFGGGMNDGTGSDQSGEYLDRIRDWPINADDSMISAADVNDYLDMMNTPHRQIQQEFLGNGQKFKDIADQYGLNVVTLLGQMALETQLGHNTCGGAPYNFGCMMYADWQNEKFGSTSIGPRPWSNPPDVWAGVEQQAYLVKFNYVDKDYIKYGDYLERYSPGFENHTDGPNSASHNGFARAMVETGEAMGYDFPPNPPTKDGNGQPAATSSQRYHNKDKKGDPDVDGVGQLAEHLDIGEFASRIGNSQFIPDEGPVISSEGGMAQPSILESNEEAANPFNGYNEDRDELMIWAMDNDFNPAYAVALINILTNNGKKDLVGTPYNFTNDPEALENIGTQGHQDLSFEDGAVEDLTQLIERIMRDVPAGVRWQVAVEPIGDAGIQATSTGNELGRQNSASTIKVGLAMAAYEKGLVGGRVSESDIEDMINISDNQATNRVIDALGGVKGADAALKDLGMRDTNLGRKMEEKDGNNKNVTTASDLAKLLTKLDRAEGGDKIKQFMTNTGSSNTRLLSKLPEGASGINKSGENSGLRNDTAIITANGKSVAVAVMMESAEGETGHVDISVLDELQARLGREIAEVLLEEHDDEDDEDDDSEDGEEGDEEDSDEIDPDARYQSDGDGRVFDSRYGSQYFAYEYQVNDMYQGLDHLLALLKEDNPDFEFTPEILEDKLMMTPQQASQVIPLAKKLGAKTDHPELPEGTGANVKIFTYGGAGPDDNEGLGNIRINGKVDDTKIGDSLKYYTQNKEVPFGDVVSIDGMEKDEHPKAIKGHWVEAQEGHAFTTWFSKPTKEYEPNMIPGLWDHGFGSIFKIAKQEYFAIPVYLDTDGKYKQVPDTPITEKKENFQGTGNMNVAVSNNEYVMLGIVTPFGSIDMMDEYIDEITKLNRILEKIVDGEDLTESEESMMMNHSEQTLMVRDGFDENDNTIFKQRRASEEESKTLKKTVALRDDDGNITSYQSIPQAADFYATNRVKELDTKNKLRDTQGYQYLYDYLTHYEVYVPHITEHDLDVVERFRRMNDITMGEQEGVDHILDIFDRLFDDGTEGGNGNETGPGGTGSTGEFGEMEERMKEVYNMLTSGGLSSAAAVGMISNMVVESNVDPTAVFSIYDSPGVMNDAKKDYLQANPKDPIGLIQWLGPRRAAMEAAAESQGVDWWDLQFQVDYLFKEDNHEQILPRMNQEPNTIEGAQKAGDGFFLVSEMHGGDMSFYDTPPTQDASAMNNIPDRNSMENIEKIWNTVVDSPIDADDSKLSQNMGGSSGGGSGSSSSSSGNSNDDGGGRPSSDVSIWGDGTGFKNNFFFAFNRINDTVMSMFGSGERAQDPTLFATMPTYNDTEFSAYWMTKINRAMGWGGSGAASNAGGARHANLGGLPIDPKIEGVQWEGGWGSYGNHRGVDIAAPEGTSIYAVSGGTVKIVESGCTMASGPSCGGEWGNYVLIEHPDGTATNHAHMSQVLVSEGDRVSEGQEIGKVGSTGRSDGPHLHFELWTNANDSESRVPSENYMDFSVYANYKDNPAAQGVGEGDSTSGDGDDDSSSEGGNRDATINSDTQLYNSDAQPYKADTLIINGADAYRWSKHSNKQTEEEADFVIRQFIAVLESRDARPVYYDELYERFDDYEDARVLEEYYKFNLLGIFDSQNTGGDDWTGEPAEATADSLTGNDENLEMLENFADNGQAYVFQGEENGDVLNQRGGEVVYANKGTVIVRDENLGLTAYHGLGTLNVSKGQNIGGGQKLGSSASDGTFKVSGLQRNANVTKGLSSVEDRDYQEPQLNFGGVRHQGDDEGQAGQHGIEENPSSTDEDD